MIDRPEPAQRLVSNLEQGNEEKGESWCLKDKELEHMAAI